MTLSISKRALRPIRSFRPRAAVSPLRSAAVSLFSRTRIADAEGRCGSCERHASWHERLGYYVCAECGQDPVEHADAG